MISAICASSSLVSKVAMRRPVGLDRVAGTASPASRTSISVPDVRLFPHNSYCALGGSMPDPIRLLRQDRPRSRRVPLESSFVSLGVRYGQPACGSRMNSRCACLQTGLRVVRVPACPMQSNRLESAWFNGHSGRADLRLLSIGGFPFVVRHGVSAMHRSLASACRGP